MEKEKPVCKKQEVTVNNELALSEDVIKILFDNASINNKYAAKITELNCTITGLIDHQVLRSNNKKKYDVQKNLELCHEINGFVVDMLEINKKMEKIMIKQAKAITQKIDEEFKKLEKTS